MIALVFVALFTVPMVLVFSSMDGGGGFQGGPGAGSRDGPSLVPRERFAQAWAKVRDETGPEESLTILRVAPDGVNAIVKGARGNQRLILVGPDLSVREFPGGSSSQRGLSIRRFDTALPERLVRRAAERVGQRPSDINYLALSAIPSARGGGVWSIFFDRGRHLTADLDGSSMRVIGQ